MKTIEKSMSGWNIVPALHELIDRVGNAVLSMEINNSLRVFFEEMATMAEPQTSKFVRLQTKLGLQTIDVSIPWSSYYLACLRELVNYYITA